MRKPAIHTNSEKYCRFGETRWTAQRKIKVLEACRTMPVEEVARHVKVSVEEIERWAEQWRKRVGRT